MSRYEWETADIKLPTAAVTGVKKALRGATNDLHERALRAAHDFWEHHAKRTRSTRLYRERLDTYISYAFRTDSWGRTRSNVALPSSLCDEFYDLLDSVTDRPHKLTVAEVAQVFPKATNRDKTFSGGEWAVTVDGTRLTWRIPENNHAVDDAYEHPLMQALQSQLRRVQWTRGTGGTAWGGDEYAVDAAQDHGYDPVSVKQHYGPLGKAARGY